MIDPITLALALAAVAFFFAAAGATIHYIQTRRHDRERREWAALASALTQRLEHLSGENLRLLKTRGEAVAEYFKVAGIDGGVTSYDPHAAAVRIEASHYQQVDLPAVMVPMNIDIPMPAVAHSPSILNDRDMRDRVFDLLKHDLVPHIVQVMLEKKLIAFQFIPDIMDGAVLHVRAHFFGHEIGLPIHEMFDIAMPRPYPPIDFAEQERFAEASRYTSRFAAEALQRLEDGDAEPLHSPDETNV